MTGRGYQPQPLPLVSTTVVLQLASAWVLGSVAAMLPRPGWVIGVIAILAAIGLNLLRFVIWGYAHRRFPISHTYPLTALFFPCVLVLSYFRGDLISMHQIAGTLLITIGAFWLGAVNGRKDIGHG
jgi:hypothetical protein